MLRGVRRRYNSDSGAALVAGRRTDFFETKIEPADSGEAQTEPADFEVGVQVICAKVVRDLRGECPIGGWRSHVLKAELGDKIISDAEDAVFSKSSDVVKRINIDEATHSVVFMVKAEVGEKISDVVKRINDTRVKLALPKHFCLVCQRYPDGNLAVPPTQLAEKFKGKNLVVTPVRRLKRAPVRPRVHETDTEREIDERLKGAMADSFVKPHVVYDSDNPFGWNPDDYSTVPCRWTTRTRNRNRNPGRVPTNHMNG